MKIHWRFTKCKRFIYCAIARKDWEISELEPRHKDSEIKERQLALGMQNSLVVIEAMNPSSYHFKTSILWDGCLCEGPEVMEVTVLRERAQTKQ